MTEVSLGSDKVLAGPHFFCRLDKRQVEFFSYPITLIFLLPPPPPTFKDLCDDIGPTQIIQNNFSILRSVN